MSSFIGPQVNLSRIKGVAINLSFTLLLILTDIGTRGDWVLLNEVTLDKISNVNRGHGKFILSRFRSPVLCQNSTDKGTTFTTYITYHQTTNL